MSGAATATGETGAVTDRARRWTDMSESVRQRTDLFAKSISTLGTAALTAIGIAKFADVFPLPPFDDISLGLWVALGATVGGFAAMGIAIVCFSVRLWRVNEPIFMDLALEQVSDPELEGAHGLDTDELKRVKAVFRAEAGLHGKDTLTRYAATADQLEATAAATFWPSRAAGYRAQAQAVRKTVDEAQARALVNVVRLRARSAVTGVAIVWYVTFLLGLIGFGLGSDYLDSQHTANVSAARDCAASVRSVSSFKPANDSLIPDLCGNDPKPVPAEEPATSTGAELSGALPEVTRRYAACLDALAAAEKRGTATAEDRARCAQLRRAVLTVLGSEPASGG